MQVPHVCKRFRRIAALFFLILAAALLVSCGRKATDYEQVSEAEKLIIRFSHVVGEDTPKGQAARRFAALMKERTNGRVEVQVFANGSLYSDYEELKALQEGYIQMIAPSLSKLSELAPEVEAFDLPFLYPSLTDYHRVLDGEAGRRLTEMIEQKGLVPLAFWDNAFKQFTSSPRPIHVPSDMQGMRVRIMPSKVLNKQFAMLGAKPLEMSFNDVYLALEKGQLDGQENTISNIYTKRFYRVQDHLTISNHGYLGYLVLMNGEFWERLPDEIRQTFVETIREVTLWERQMAEQINREQLDYIKACDCISIYRLTPDEKRHWKQFFQPLYQSELTSWDPVFVKALHLPAP
ncbi:DctP family TRAP transporter solute-binding subunit [Brevibacillus humidisoli]|uniref:DctP family TRAP transporter solute-binding subunit n=1 Tax=Brevibacillus humidisoli TaxID=2895522 RepID=UPI001E2B2734|nr:DctP family TRAP transporter solute-binding subunit [Brevibacillus humidisoli]UFJ38906.1 DctP family TRAP transporter solute-binding subunit [Brevibacillus humidisoli]